MTITAGLLILYTEPETDDDDVNINSLLQQDINYIKIEYI